MSCYSYHSSRPDPWVAPRQPLDPAIRALAYGPVQSMYEPTWFERLLRSLRGRG